MRADFPPAGDGSAYHRLRFVLQRLRYVGIAPLCPPATVAGLTLWKGSDFSKSRLLSDVRQYAAVYIQYVSVDKIRGL